MPAATKHLYWLLVGPAVLAPFAFGCQEQIMGIRVITTQHRDTARMNVTTVCLAAVLHAVLLSVSCQNSSNQVSSQATRTSSSEQASSDRELLKNVEIYAGLGDDASSAWQNLMSHDREKLARDLGRISDGLPSNDRNRVLIAFAFCKMRYDYDSNRKIVLSALAKKSPYKDLGGDWAVTLIASLLIDGDKDLLVPLLQAAEWSDGAMAMDLSRVYYDALSMDTDGFLASLVKQSKNTRKNVTYLIRNNSRTPEQNQRIIGYLKKISPPSKVAPIAAQIWKRLSQP